MSIEALLWKYGTPEAVIEIAAGAIVAWVDCTTETPPNAQQIADAEAEYAQWLEDLAWEGDLEMPEWRSWENEDMDAGANTLLSFPAPAVDASWVVEGRLRQAAGMVAFTIQAALRCTPNPYQNGVDRHLSITVHHTEDTGTAADNVAWKDGNGNLYADFHAETGRIRIRAALTGNDWSAAGRYMRTS